jgi:predicted DNA-binding transcriptional regulator AlpA
VLPIINLKRVKITMSAVSPYSVAESSVERPDDILRLPDIEARYGIPLATLRHMRATGQGPKFFVLAGRVVVWRRDFLDWVSAEQVAQAVNA